MALKPSESPSDLSRGLAALALLALPLALFWPALLGGKMLWGADIETLELVFKTSAQRSLAQGEWPLWMPEILGGMPGITLNCGFADGLPVGLQVMSAPLQDERLLQIAYAIEQTLPDATRRPPIP